MTQQPAFDRALPILLEEEGGYTDNSHDPGGVTNLGVTAKTWAAYTGRPADRATMRSLTPAMVAPLYKAQYWDKVNGDALGAALGLVVFDFAVNAGPGRAAKMLQGIVGVAEDGQIGRGTLQAVQAYVAKYPQAAGLAPLIEAYCDARRAYYRKLPTFRWFGKGWLARVDRVEQEALKLV